MNRLVLLVIGAGLFAGCGGTENAAATQTPTPDASASDDSSTGAGGSASEAGTAPDVTVASEAGIDLDAFPIPDGPIGECAICIRDTCQTDLATCATDPKCQMGVLCSIQNCAQYAMGSDAGAAGLLCLTTCFGDLTTALSALAGLTCVTTKCDACTSLLDGGSIDF